MLPLIEATNRLTPDSQGAEIIANLPPHPADDSRSILTFTAMSKRILSIDDSRMVHRVITKTLKPLNIEVLTAFSGQEGIEKAEQEKPDLILLDASMPVMDGLEALAVLKANPATRDIPVVMLSTDSDRECLDRACQQGALTCIPKPFTGDALVASLSALLDFGQKAA